MEPRLRSNSCLGIPCLVIYFTVGNWTKEMGLFNLSNRHILFCSGTGMFGSVILLICRQNDCSLRKRKLKKQGTHILSAVANTLEKERMPVISLKITSKADFPAGNLGQRCWGLNLFQTPSGDLLPRWVSRVNTSLGPPLQKVLWMVRIQRAAEPVF